MTGAEVQRRVFCAIVAKLVSPMDQERAAAALTSMLPMLAGLPNAAFDDEMARRVCANGRVVRPALQANAPDAADLPAQYGPFTRVPTYGELLAAMERLYADRRRVIALAAPEPFTALPSPAVGPRDWTPEAAEHVRRVVSAFVTERSFNDPAAILATRRAIRPRYVTDAQLMAGYERLAAEGNHAAGVRVSMLRAQQATPKPRSARALFEDAP